MRNLPRVMRPRRARILRLRELAAALNEERGLVLVSDDERILELATDVSRPLVGGLPAG